jgi:hypothetical protein
VAANSERLRFYVDESALGVGKTLAAAREDTIHVGHPLIPECPFGVDDPTWISAVALKNTLSLQAPPDPRWRAFRGVATASDQPHRLRCSDPVAQIYLDPESAAGLALRQRMGAAGVQSIEIDDTEALAAALRPSPNLTTGRRAPRPTH